MTEQQSAPEAASADDAALATTVERLSRMSPEEVDDLPYGFVVLDAEGVVLLYNRYEERLSRMPADRVVGRNWFRDIAPCTRVEAFYGRFRALAAQAPGATERFAFRFHFLHGAQDVFVQFARAPDDRVFMTVHRRPLKEASDAPRALRQETDRGLLNSPVGALFPLTWEHASALLVHSGVGPCREVGVSAGRAIARAVERDTSGALANAPVQLAASLLDDALATLGLGRLACDVNARPERVACFVRPPVASRSTEIAAFYEGVLEAAISAALGAPHVARCIEGAELEAVPWRFILVPADRAHEIALREGERPDDRARRFGLLEDIGRERSRAP